MYNSSKKIIQNGSFDDISKLVLIASNNKYKELILIYEGCYKFSLKTFDIEVFFEETKKCLIESRSKNCVKIDVQIILL